MQLFGGDKLKTKDQICGTCEWHKHEYIDDGYVCVYYKSDYCTDHTDYEHYCSKWEAKEQKRASNA